MEPTPMGTLISSLQQMFGQTITNIGTIATTIVGQPLLLIGCAFLFTGVMFKFFRKLIVNS